MGFETPLVLFGPFRAPRQMLAHQTYGGHSSIHDDAMAQKLGLKAGPIEGPTHFSQYDPLLCRIWGHAWFERGCVSAHYQNMMVEGEEVRAFAEMPRDDTARRLRIWVEKSDGTSVQEASATLGPDRGRTLLEERMAKLTPPDRLVILEHLKIGMTGARDERVSMSQDRQLGGLYPFSLNEKLAVITENSPWYSDPEASPWGRAIIPTEMVSALALSTLDEAGFPVKGPSVGLLADQEIRMIEGPLFVDEEYVLRREIVALSESRRTESYWFLTRIFDHTGKKQVAEMLVNSARLKASYAGYEAESVRTSRGAD
jgi:hypothetical protein